MAERLDPAVRRHRILETAMAVISEEGYRGLTLRGLARRCDMSAPGLMHHFEDLPTLLMAVLEHRDARDLARLMGEGSTAVTARELADATIEGMIERPEEAQLFAMLEAEALDPAHPAHQHFRDRAVFSVESIRPVVEREYLEPDELSQRLFAVMDGLQLPYLRDPGGFDLRGHWTAIADAVFGSAARRT